MRYFRPLSLERCSSISLGGVCHHFVIDLWPPRRVRQMLKIFGLQINCIDEQFASTTKSVGSIESHALVQGLHPK